MTLSEKVVQLERLLAATSLTSRQQFTELLSSWNEDVIYAYTSSVLGEGMTKEELIDYTTKVMRLTERIES